MATGALFLNRRHQTPKKSQNGNLRREIFVFHTPRRCEVLKGLGLLMQGTEQRHARLGRKGTLRHLDHLHVLYPPTSGGSQGIAS